MKNLSIDDLKVMWVVGAAERLATLGIFSSDVPLKIASDAIDTYIQIDDVRDCLFEDDKEVAMIFEVMARTESCEEIDKESMDDMIDLILEYKNNRTQLVKHALSYGGV